MPFVRQLVFVTYLTAIGSRSLRSWKVTGSLSSFLYNAKGNGKSMIVKL